MKSLATIYLQKARELLNKMVALWLPSNQVCGLYMCFDKTLRISTRFLHKYNVFLSISKIQQIYVCLSATLWYIILPQSKMYEP